MDQPRQSRQGYRELAAFERLLWTIAAIAAEPGMGATDRGGLAALAAAVRDRAIAAGRDWPVGYPSVATLRKDLETLRRYGLLDKPFYRWGYYVGAGALTVPELAHALQALGLVGLDLADGPMARSRANVLRRIKAWDQGGEGRFSYPLRRSRSRPITELDPATQMAQGGPWDSAVERLEDLEGAILAGQALELIVARSPHRDRRGRRERLYPLQLIFEDVGWYLLYEKVETGHFATGRLERFSDRVVAARVPARGMARQCRQLLRAEGLLEAGWGLFLGEPEEQRCELMGELPLEAVRVRFFGGLVDFIVEGDRRHGLQRLEFGPRQGLTYEYVDYCVPLPPRSRDAFLRWVLRYGDLAELMEPEGWAADLRGILARLGDRYGLRSPETAEPKG